MGLLSTSFAYLFNWRCIQANEMPESPRRVGQRANQGLWRGVAASRGGESRNGGRGPVEHGWGRSALRGVPQCGSRLGGPREQTPGGEERPAACLSLRATARDQVSNKSPRASPAVRCWAGPATPPEPRWVLRELGPRPHHGPAEVV